MAKAKDETHIKILKPLGRNPRRHNPRNIGMIVDSLQTLGAARSIVIDENNEILAGNGTIEAAAEAGITKLQVVEADGETIVAVRRRGLTDEQKKRLAVVDNRANETSDWDAEVLREIAEEQSLADFFTDEEWAILAAQSNDDDWAGALGGLPDGDKSPFQQMTFTLSDAQAGIVEDAMTKAKAAGAFVDTGNENSNGNALARICAAYLSA